MVHTVGAPTSLLAPAETFGMGSISGFICMQYVITHMSHKHTVVVHGGVSRAVEVCVQVGEQVGVGVCVGEVWWSQRRREGGV